MPRDYAKSPRRAGKSKSTHESTPGWIWLFTGIFLGLFIGGLAYLNKHSVNNTNKLTVTVKESQKTSPETDTKFNQPHPAPRFDFYTMLPQNQTPKEVVEEEPNQPPSQTEEQTTVENPETAADDSLTATESNQPVAPKMTAESTNNIKTTSSKAAKISRDLSKAPAKAKESYILTVAALKNYQDADQLKAQLILLGFDVHIKAIKAHDVTLQRVWLGPYASFAAAQKDQQRLSENHFKGLLVKQTSLN